MSALDEKEKKDIEGFVSGLVGETVEMPMLTDEMLDESRRALESFGKADRSFDCIMCGNRFTPAEGQFIFYELCDRCFGSFDSQKMCGRYLLFGMLKSGECNHPNHFESAKAWAEDARVRFVAYMEGEIARIASGGNLPAWFSGTRDECLSSMRAELQYFQSRAPS